MCVNLQDSAVSLFNLCIQDSLFYFFLLISFPQGLIHVRQIPRLNNLIGDVSDVKDLAFKLRRKLFTIEVRENFYISVHSLEVNSISLHKHVFFTLVQFLDDVAYF